MSTRRECKHCHGTIAFEAAFGTWYHIQTDAARCKEDASFIFAEPKDLKVCRK